MDKQEYGIQKVKCAFNWLKIVMMMMMMMIMTMVEQQPARVTEKNDVTILWGMPIHTNREVGRPVSLTSFWAM